MSDQIIINILKVVQHHYLQCNQSTNTNGKLMKNQFHIPFIKVHFLDMFSL